MKDRLILHAVNVHTGGGKTLLTGLLESCDRTRETLALLDSRMQEPVGIPDSLSIMQVPPTMLRRLAAEIWLYKSTTAQDFILCFGNLPPLFRLRGHVAVFVQNRYLIDGVGLHEFSLKTRLRLMVERIWLAARKHNADEYIVQTPSMKLLLESRTGGCLPARILPFVKDASRYQRSSQSTVTQSEKNERFLYVASGEPHKNHRRLIDAWCLLAEEGKFPGLILTLDDVKFRELCGWIEARARQYELRLENRGRMSDSGLVDLYSTVDALIYPSTFESFGLPLIEARTAGLPILASELDYVRDVIDPEESFDPGSARSIARAVRRFIGEEEAVLPLQDASEFLQNLLDRAD